MTDDNGNSPNGYGAYVSMIISAIGILAAVLPHWTILATLAQYKDDLRNVLGPALLGIGTVCGAISHPPAAVRERYDDLKHWVGFHFRRKVQP